MPKTVSQVIEQIVTCQKCKLHQSCRSPVPMSLGRSRRSSTSSSSVTPVEQDAKNLQQSSVQIDSSTSPGVRIVETPGKSPQGSTALIKNFTLSNFIVLGEAPGRVEDHRGVPFIGQAGQLLRSQLKIEGIYDQAVFMNTVSCWPRLEEDMHPTTEQVRACRGNLKDQLAVTDADYVLACGLVALQALLPHAKVMKHAMGKLIEIHGKLVFPIFHPSYVLRANDPTVNRKWEHEVSRFGIVVRFRQDATDREGCIYCSKITTPGSLICYGHRTAWRTDQIWERRNRGKRPPQEERLF